MKKPLIILSIFILIFLSIRFLIPKNVPEKIDPVVEVTPTPVQAFSACPGYPESNKALSKFLEQINFLNVQIIQEASDEVITQDGRILISHVLLKRIKTPRDLAKLILKDSTPPHISLTNDEWDALKRFCHKIQKNLPKKKVIKEKSSPEPTVPPKTDSMDELRKKLKGDSEFQRF